MRRTVIALLLLVTLTACGSERTQDEIAADCQKAIDETSTKTNRPEECKGLSDDNYRLVLAHWILEQQGAFDSPTP